ncbi:3-oxo-5-alpha-steroid 4-dehydrogenase 1-like [Babylonia areolata]|uniref:3-oxo-5-alpha-steroid 4-dehydrogenase 1-like n=1 Tax=Babylonia areolata TaxID=304850 RepID=UPI003FD09C6B
MWWWEKDVEETKHYYDYLSYVFFAWATCVALSLKFAYAPYGRYSRRGWGCLIPGRVAWLVQELPSVVVPILVLLLTPCPRASHWRNQVAVGLFLLHYFQRTFVFPLMIKGGKPTPLFPFVVAFFFCVLNGYLQAGHLLNVADLDSGSSLRFYAGIVIFITGMGINLHSDHILRSLRKPGEEGYKIPYGGMFRFISGANFFGEALEWIGFAVLTGTLPAAAFAYFTACNVGPRACHHHRWYQDKFEDYPKDRKAFIPFLL